MCFLLLCVSEVREARAQRLEQLLQAPWKCLRAHHITLSALAHIFVTARTQYTFVTAGAGHAVVFERDDFVACLALI